MGAAAAVAVVAIGAAVAPKVLSGPSSQADTAASQSRAGNESLGTGGSAGTGDDPQAAPGATNSPADGTPGPRRTRPPVLDAATVSGFARELSNGSASDFLAASRSGCERAADQHVTATSGDSGLDALVSFEGRRALLRVQRERHLLTVYACPGPSRVLYRSTY